MFDRRTLFKEAVQKQKEKDLKQDSVTRRTSVFTRTKQRRIHTAVQSRRQRLSSQQSNVDGK